MIVYLAWGSLFWNPDILPIKKWIYSSLKLPLEFSRISDNGKGRLTLVIDNKYGVYNNIWYAISNINDVNKSILKLKQREKTTIDNIAYINLKNNHRRFNNTPKIIVDNIEIWARNNNINTVIWTDLKSNWLDIMHTDYNIENAYKYFLNSELNVRLKILEYVYKSKNLVLISTNFSKYFFNQLDQ